MTDTLKGTTFDDLLVDVHDGVATVSINRPKRLNALTGDTVNELSAALAVAAEDKSIGVVVITGAGEKAFCVGGDLEWEAEGGLEGLEYTLGQEIVDHPKPIVARVNGYAIGGGNHLAYFCDFTIASDTSVFAQSGPKIGAPVGGYVVAHAASILGHKRAREMWMLCRHYSAQQAMDWGLVNAVVPAQDLDSEVRRWCDELLAISPTSLRGLKLSFRKQMEPYLDLNITEVMNTVAPDFFQSGENQEGIKAFMEKRKPDFSPWR
jgi:2-ketocyclohexanecarboxyl-CoA hydrolase